MELKRTLNHLLYDRRRIKRLFPADSLERITAAIKSAEASHCGEIRFSVEAALDWSALRSDQTARERAIEVFSQLRVWDTEYNNGILIYLLLADRDVEIVADRGIHRFVGEASWVEICHRMEEHFQRGDFETGVTTGIAAISSVLVTHYPCQGPAHNEIADNPVLL